MTKRRLAVPSSHDGTGRDRWASRRLRYRGWELAVHVRRGPEGAGTVQSRRGAVRYTERFGLDREVSPDVLQQALATVSGDLSRLDDRESPDVLVGMGGSVTNMTAVMLQLETYDADRVQGAILDRDEVDRQIELYRSRRRRCSSSDPRPANEARRCHPRGRMHRSDGHGEAGDDPADGQRPGPAPRAVG